MSWFYAVQGGSKPLVNGSLTGREQKPLGFLARLAASPESPQVSPPLHVRVPAPIPRVGGTYLGSMPPTKMESKVQTVQYSQVSTPATSPEMPSLIPATVSVPSSSPQTSPLVPVLDRTNSGFSVTPVSRTPSPGFPLVSARIVDNQAFSSMGVSPMNSPANCTKEPPFLSTLDGPTPNASRMLDRRMLETSNGSRMLNKNALEYFPGEEHPVNHQRQISDPHVWRVENHPRRMVSAPNASIPIQSSDRGSEECLQPSLFFFLGGR